MDNRNNGRQPNNQKRNNQGQNNRGGRNNRRRGGKRAYQKRDNRLETEVISLRRVAKVTAGAKRLRFSVVVVAGDKKGKIGIALGRGADPREAIQRATVKAGAKLHSIVISPETKSVPHRIETSYKSATVLIKPAPTGTGVVAGGAIRKVLQIAGIENVVAKRLGSANSLTNAYCTVLALTKLKKTKYAGKPAKDSSKES